MTAFLHLHVQGAEVHLVGVTRVVEAAIGEREYAGDNQDKRRKASAVHLELQVGAVESG